MNTIDNRILEMDFDNKKFEQNAQTSIKTLKNLDESLLLKNASKGFTEAEKAAAKVSFDPLSQAIDRINNRFSTLGVIGDQVLRRLTDAAVSAGKQLVSAFTIDPVKSGFQEYETQIDAIQTILANTKSKGTGLEEINEALDELNHYADMTIYNFTEMTKNIGRFTAAGVDLDTSVSAIKGIANLAAVSGSTSVQTSTAMYQLSQALASGTVKLMDWNSVVNANMGGEVFQEALKETARVHGIEIDAMIEKEGSFRETLSQGWLTTDILTESLEKFTVAADAMTEAEVEQARALWKSRGYTEDQIDAIFDMGQTATDAATKVKTFTQLFDTLKEAAQSGWTQSWEYIIGDFEEAKEFLTSISDEFQNIINSSANARNEVLKFWHDNRGREMFVNSLKNIYAIFKGIAEIGSEAFKTIFPPTTGQQLLDFTEKIYNFTEGLKTSLGFVDDFKEAVVETVETAAAVIDDTVEEISDSIDTSIQKDEAKAAELYSQMPEWMKLWVDRTGSSDLKRIVNWRQSNRDKWYEYWEAVTGQDMSYDSAIMDAYTEMPDWMRVWVDRSGSRDLERVSTWRQSNQDLWNAYWDAVEDAANKTEETIETVTREEQAIKQTFSEVAYGIDDVSTSVVESKPSLTLIQRIFQGAAAAANIFKNALTALASGGVKVGIALFKPLGMVLANELGVLADWVVDLDKAISEGNFFEKTISKILGVATPLGEVLASAAVSLFDFIKYLYAGGGKELAINVLTMAAYGIYMLVSAIVSAAKSIKNYIDSSEIIQNGISAIAKVLGNLPRYALTAFNAIKEFVRGIAEYVSESEIIGKWTDTLKTKFESFLSTIINFYNKIKEFLGKKFGKIDISGIKDFVKNFLKGFDPLQKIDNVFSMFSSLFAGTNLKEKFTNLFNEISKIFSKENAANFKEKISEFISVVMEWIGDLFVDLKDGATGLLGSAGEKIKSVFDWFAELFSGIINNFTGMDIITFFKTIKNFYIVFSVLNLLRGVTNFLNAPAKFLKTLGESTEGLTDAIGDFAKSVKSKASNIGGTVLKIALSIGILVAALFVLSTLDPVAFENSMAALIAIGAGLLIFIGILSKIAGSGKGIKDIGTGLLMISGSIALLIYSANKLAKMEWGDMAKGFGALFVLMTIMSSFLRGTGGVAFNGSFGAFIGMALAVRLLVWSVQSLGKLDLDTLIQGLVGLGVVLFELSSFLKGVGTNKISGGFGLILMAIALRVVVESLKAIGDMSFGDLVKGLIGMFVLVNLMGSLAKSGGSITNIFGMLLNMGMFAAALYGFVKAMQALEGISAAHMLGVSVSFAAIVLSFAASVAILSGIGFGGAIGAIGALAVILAGLTGIGILASYLSENEWVMDRLGKAGDFMKSIGTMIGKFIEGIANPNGIQKADTGIAQKLNQFMTDIQPFLQQVKNIDSATVEGFKNLSASLNSVILTGFLEGIASFVTGKSSFETFSTGMSELVPGLATINRCGDLLDKEKIQNTTDCLGLIVDFVDKVPDYDIFEKLTGLTDINSFAGDLVLLGPNLQAYSDSVAGLKSENITGSVDAITALTTVAASVPEEGLIEKLAGVSNLKLFVDELPPLGRAIFSYSFYVRNLTTSKVEAIANSVAALDAIVELANKVPDNSVIENLAHVSDLGTFSEDLSKMASGIMAFATSASGFSDDDAANVDRASSMIRSVVDVAKDIPEEGFFTKMFNLSDMQAFASNLAFLGPRLSIFASKVSGLTESDVTAAGYAGGIMKAFVDGFGDVEKKGGILEAISSMFSGSNNLTTYSSEMVTFAEDMAEFASYFGANAENNIQTAVDTATNVIDKIKGMYATPEEQSNEDIANLLGFSSFLDILTDTMNSSVVDFYDIGTDIIQNIVDGIDAKTTDLSNSFKAALNSSVSVFNGYYSQFYNSGRNMMLGVANGIRSNTGLAIAAANSAATSTLNAYNSRLKIQSPSKEFEESSKYSMMGIANGFKKYSYLAENSASGMADDLFDLIDYTLSNISALLNSNMDLQPTIRPVLDMSNVNNGLSSMSGLFGANRSMTLSGINVAGISARNLNAISAQTNQNGSNFNSKEIVQAINNLEERFDVLNERMDHMRVVLDNGVMVGQMLPEINYRLGRKIVYDERGI